MSEFTYNNLNVHVVSEQHKYVHLITVYLYLPIQQFVTNHLITIKNKVKNKT